MPRVHFRDGTTWKDATVKKREGNSWVDADVFVYSGNSWVNATRQVYTKTWASTWSRSYYGYGDKRTNSHYGHTRMYQGKYSGSYNTWGLQRSMFGFNIASIRAELAGANIKDVKLYLRNQHWYWTAGGSAIIGLHNSSSEPTKFSQTRYNEKAEYFYSGRGVSKWIDFPNDVGEDIRDGDIAGFTLMANSTKHTYYGYFYGASTSYAPKLRITYEK